VRTLLIAAAMWLQTVSAPPPLETIARDAMSQVDAPRQAVARNDAEWAALWKQHAPAAERPKVDFASRTVVAVFLGSRPSAGYAVEMTGTRLQDGAVIVLWSERRPAPGQMTAQVITSPAHLATIAKVPGEIRFEKIAP